MGKETSGTLAWANGDSLKDVYPEGIDWDFKSPKRDLLRLIDWAIAEFSQNSFSDFMGRTMTYKEAGYAIDRSAAGLQKNGIKPGMTIGLHMANTPYYPVMFFAALKAGATIVNLSPLDSPAQHAAKVKDGGIDLIVTLNIKKLYDKDKALLDQGLLKKIVVCPLQDVMDPLKKIGFNLFKRAEKAIINVRDMRILSFSALCDNNGAYIQHRPSLDDTVLLQYTGGTTGIPKGAMLSHFNLMAGSGQFTQFFASNVNKPAHSRSFRMGMEKTVAAVPFFHIFGLATMLMTLRLGGQLILIPQPTDTKSVIQAIKRTKATIFPAVPALLQKIAETMRDNKNSFVADDLGSLKAVVSGGSPLTPGARKGFEEAIGKSGIIMQAYGMTETSPLISCNPPHGENRPMTVGVPAPGTEIRIADLDDPSATKNLGEPGEILVRGPQVMKGYFNRPDETAKILTPDGWLRTGDIGMLDDLGYLTIADRAKDMIINNGFKVFPTQVENALCEHPAVAECVVVAAKKGEINEVPKAFVRLKPNAEVDAKELKDFLKSRLGPFEIPRFIEFRTEELPKTPIGKPDRKSLQDQETAVSSAAAPPAPTLKP